MSHADLKPYLRPLLPFCVCLGILCGCSGTTEAPRYTGGASIGGGGAASIKRPAPSPSVSTQDLPWELLWSEGRTIKGEELSNLLLLQGDRALSSGDRRAALGIYQKARAAGLSAAEQESAVVRVAAMQLSLSQPDAALRTTSEYFTASRKQVQDVPAEFSLLFGYAYSRRNDLDQAMAWLARARSTSQPQSRIAFAAQNEVAAVLRGVSPKQFEDLAAMWQGDEFVSASISAERMRRSRGGEINPAPNGAALPPPLLLNPGEVRLGAVLPLQGRFAALGRNVQNGIELAVAGQGADPPVKFTVQDSGDSVEQATAATQTLLSSAYPTMVLGPLVSEQAGAVQSLVDAARVPSISFSRRSDFIPSVNSFRLGVTIESQIDSLLTVAHDRLGFTKFALVSSEDAALAEVSEVFRRKLRELRLELIWEGVYERSNKDSAATLAGELEKAPAQAVFFADNIAAASAIYAGIPEEIRGRIAALGISNWDNRGQLMSSRTVLDGAVLVSPFFAQSTRPIVGGFVTAYRTKYGQEPDFLAAQGFDAATMALQAAKRAHAATAPLLDALKAIDVYDGLTGRVYVGADGELRRSYAVLQIRGGVLRELNAPDAAAGTPEPAASVATAAQPAAEATTPSPAAPAAPVTAPVAAPVIAPPPPEAPTLGTLGRQ